MTIVEKIKQSISGVTGMMVYYHDLETLNMIADRAQYPCVFFQLLTDGNVERQSGQVRESVSAAIFFVEPTHFDFDADENEEIIDRCKKAAFGWLAGISKDDYIDVVSIARTQRVYERFDSILTGFGMIVTIKELQGFTIC